MGSQFHFGSQCKMSTKKIVQYFPCFSYHVGSVGLTLNIQNEEFQPSVSERVYL